MDALGDRHSAWCRLLLAAALAGCSEPGAPTIGGVSVTVETTGVDLDPDGYVVKVGPETRQVPANGSVEGIANPGAVLVQISGVAPNCILTSPASQTVQVPASGTIQVVLHVTCSTLAAQVVIRTTTLGQDPDPNGYTFTFDGHTFLYIGTNEQRAMTGLPLGPLTVTLSDIAAHCTATPNPATVQIAIGTAPLISFVITCAPITAGLVVRTTTSGHDPDADGYDVSVDGGTFSHIGTDSSRLFTRLPPGPRLVTLQGLAAHCAAGGPNPAPVSLTVGVTDTVTMPVTCSTITGDLFISVASTGQDIPPSGYFVSYDDIIGRDLRPTDSVMIPRVPPGTHTIDLQHPRTCTITPSAPVTVAVVAGDTARLSLLSQCVRIPGIAVDVTWTSAYIGLFSLLDSTIERLTPTGTTNSGATWSPDGTELAYSCNLAICVSNLLTGSTRSFYSGVVNQMDLAWKPDGSDIAFAGNIASAQTIWLVRPDGSNFRQIPNSGLEGGAPTWSPDGSRLAFPCRGPDIINNAFDLDICVINADGSGRANLTSHTGFDTSPAWSPDGRRIAFTRAADAQSPPWLYLMNADGSNVTLVPTSGPFASAPDWSPDGQHLVFVAGQDVWVINVDGTAEAKLTKQPGYYGHPKWRPGP